MKGSSAILCIDITFDDKIIASGGEDYYLRIWDKNKKIKKWEFKFGGFYIHL